MKNSWLRTGYCVLVLSVIGCQSIQGAHSQSYAQRIEELYEKEKKEREDPIIKLFSPDPKMEKGLRLVAMLPVGKELKDIAHIGFNIPENHLLVDTANLGKYRYYIPLKGKPNIPETLKPIFNIHDADIYFSGVFSGVSDKTWHLIVPYLQEWPVETNRKAVDVSRSGRFVAALNNEKTHIFIFAFEEQRKPSRKLLKGTITSAMIEKLENDLPIKPISKKAKEELARIARNNLRPEPRIEKAYHLIGTITYSSDLQIGDIGLPRRNTLALALAKQKKTLFFNLKNWEQMAIREGIDTTLFPLQTEDENLKLAAGIQTTPYGEADHTRLAAGIKITSYYDEGIRGIMPTRLDSSPLLLQPWFPRVDYISPDGNYTKYPLRPPTSDNPFDTHSNVAISPSATKAAWFDATTRTIYVYQLKTRKVRT